MKKKFITLALAALMVCFLLAGCYQPTEETKFTNEIQNQITDMLGFPNVSHFFEYAQLKSIYEMRDNPNLICYWYTKNDMSGKWVYQGTCIGYGIPYAASITSPESMQRWTSAYDYERLPMSEPNGLYVDGLSTSATWILSTDVEGTIYPMYVESEITISQYKLAANRCEDWSLPSDY